MAKFQTQLNRQAWNRQATWLYKTAQMLADDPEKHEIKTIDDLYQELLVAYAKSFKNRTVSINRWSMSCGLDKPNSVDRAAFVISEIQEP